MNAIETKVAAGATFGAVATLVVYLAGLFGLEVTPEAAAAFAVVLGAIAAYFAPHSGEEVSMATARGLNWGK